MVMYVCTHLTPPTLNLSLSDTNYKCGSPRLKLNILPPIILNVFNSKRCSTEFSLRAGLIHTVHAV